MGIPYYFRSLIRSRRHVVRTDKLDDVDVLCLDFNCAIHHFLGDGDIANVIKGLEIILDQFVSPPRIVYCAIDGVVPKAKQIQQRNRRFAVVGESQGFDRNQISPCTPFMQELERELRLRFPDMILSPSSEPGEGEHKIMAYLAESCPLAKRICIYGLDSDLILLALQDVHRYDAMHLLREQKEFGGGSQQGAAATEYATLDVCALAEALAPTAAPTAYIDLCNVFGNDFLPPLACMSLRAGGHERLQGLMKGLNTVESLLPLLASQEERLLQEGLSTFTRSVRGPSDNPIEDVPKAWMKRVESIRFGQPGWRARYYAAVLGSTREGDIQVFCETYWTTLHWVRSYYRDHVRCPSWSWYFPYGGAPLAVDLCKYPLEAGRVAWQDPSVVPSAESQLKFILPPRSWLVCGLGSAGNMGTSSIQGHAGYVFKRFLWECKPILA